MFLKLTILLFLFSCLGSNSLQSKKVGITNDGENDTEETTPINNSSSVSFTDVGKKFLLSLNIKSKFGTDDLISIDESSVKIVELPNGLLLIYLEYQDINVTESLIFITDKSGKIVESKRLSVLLTTVKSIFYSSTDSSIFLIGDSLILSQEGEVLIKFDSSLSLLWQTYVDIPDQSEVSFQFRNPSIYIFSHTETDLKNFMMTKISADSGEIEKTEVYNFPLRPVKSFSNPASVTSTITINDSNDFVYRYLDIADDSEEWATLLKFNFESEQFYLNVEIETGNVPAQLSSSTLTCTDASGDTFIYHQNYFILQKYNSSGDLIFENNIESDFLPHIPSTGFILRCHESNIQLIGQAQMNSFNSDTIGILSNFLKSTGDFISTQQLLMEERRERDFYISYDYNQKAHYFLSEKIEDEPNFILHISGSNF